MDRYQSIIDRQMFGPLPKGFDPTKNPADVKANGKAAEKELSKEQEQLQAAIHFSMINITPSGAVAVGFTDNSDSKNPVHYYLKVGEQRNGWEVKEADPVKAWMKIAKGEVEVEMELGGKSGAAKSQTRPDGGGVRGAPALPARTLGAADKSVRSPGLTGRSSLLGGAKSLRARKEEREAAQREREAKAAEEKARQEAERQQMREEMAAMKEEVQRQREEREAAEAAKAAEEAAGKNTRSPAEDGNSASDEPVTLQEDEPND